MGGGPGGGPIAHDRRLDLDGRGLLLLPSAFGGVTPTVVLDPPWQPALSYPARGGALLWDHGAERAPAALAGVLGRTRALILATLDAPRSTTELAETLGITAGGASQHLTALRAAGLVAGRREGRAVLYSRTLAADALVEAAA